MLGVAVSRLAKSRSQLIACNVTQTSPFSKHAHLYQFSLLLCLVATSCRTCRAFSACIWLTFSWKAMSICSIILLTNISLEKRWKQVQHRWQNMRCLALAVAPLAGKGDLYRDCLTEYLSTAMLLLQCCNCYTSCSLAPPCNAMWWSRM